jgi:D-alanyl-D-alanine dipeptidase
MLDDIAVLVEHDHWKRTSPRSKMSALTGRQGVMMRVVMADLVVDLRLAKAENVLVSILEKGGTCL